MTQPTDRERLARALYIIDSTESRETTKAQFWDAGGEAAEATRLDWLGQADRLRDLLGGSPVLQGEPRAWECPLCGEIFRWRGPGALKPVCMGYGSQEGHASVHQDAGTPLYAGAPAAETISAEATRQLRHDIAGLELALVRADQTGCVRLLGGEASRILDFLKVRIPTEEKNDGD